LRLEEDTHRVVLLLTVRAPQETHRERVRGRVLQVGGGSKITVAVAAS
jgi:hypothetical protein